VQPNKAGAHFNKVQCFCFEEQRLRAGEEVDMPVFFYLDPEFATDPSMAGLHTTPSPCARGVSVHTRRILLPGLTQLPTVTAVVLSLKPHEYRH